MEDKKFLTKLQQNIKYPDPIPLLIDPDHVKKEFDKSRVQTPNVFRTKEEPSSSNGDADLSSEATSSNHTMSTNGALVKEKKKLKKEIKSEHGASKRGASPGSDTTTSSSTSRVDKSIKHGKKKRMSSAEAEAGSSMRGSIREGRDMFAWIIDPVSVDNFFRTTWETRPVHICRDMPDYYKAILSTAKIDEMLRENRVMYTKNIDITSYKDGQRETHNPDGRALPAEVWDFYKQGCSIRLLNPHIFFDSIWSLNATLQEYFGCLVGANIYLTPPGTQGFAPHYDDIEAFVLQLEGRKHWRLYAPRSSEEQLPRYSSGNLEQGEIGDPIMDVVLSPGDLLYFPRGTIHQADALQDCHSLHVTLSCYQKNTWGDFLEKLLPSAVAVAIEEDKEFRQGLPLDYLQYMGVTHSDKETDPRREVFMNKIHRLIDKLFAKAPIDAAADQFGKQLMQDALPPRLTAEEQSCSAIGNSNKIVIGEVKEVAPLKMKTRVKLLRANILRIVSEEDSVRVYHCAENTRMYREEDHQFIEIDEELASGVDHLISAYPKWSIIGNLPMETDAEKLELVTTLWKKGLILTSKPLESVD